MDGYKIIGLRVLVREDDEDEVKGSLAGHIENDASVGGYVWSEDLNDDDLHVFGETIADLAEEE